MHTNCIRIALVGENKENENLCVSFKMSNMSITTGALVVAFGCVPVDELVALAAFDALKLRHSLLV